MSILVVKAEFDVKTNSQNPLSKSIKILKNAITTTDKSFNNELSKEYRCFMSYLLSRADDDSNINDESTSKAVYLDDEKHLILECLSTSVSSFDILKERHFDIETLLEVLCDLLNCLPTALIPRRFFDLCMNFNFSYLNCLEIIKCLPKCHLSLFYLINQFIYMYSKNNEINYNSIAKAIFQSDSEIFHKDTINQTLNDKNCLKFINLFIENFDQFRISFQELI